MNDLVLSAHFLEHAEGGAARFGAASVAMEEALLGAWEAGRRRWPDVALEAQEHGRWLAQRLRGREGGCAELLLATHVEDLYLTHGCARGLHPALLAFEQHFLRQVPAYLARMGRPEAFVSEVQQILRERLFVGPTARIVEYAGTGALSGWLRVLATRAALNLLRDRNERFAPERQIEDEVAAPAHLDPELDYIRARYKGEFDKALRESFAVLTERQRELLHFYYVGGVSTPKLATLFGLSHATIARHLQAAREVILTETQRLLHQRLQLTPDALRSLVNVLRSGMDFSISQVLGPFQSSEL